MSRPQRSLLVPALLVAGCYSSGAAGDAGEADGVAETADDAAVETPDDGGTLPETEACDRPICAADFPCGETSHCLDRTTVEACRNIPCWEVCGTTCCTGGSCGSSGTTACPPGGRL